jgi:tetratricopeptide (TPR) repeat protein
MATFEPKITRIESATSVQSKIQSGRDLAKQGRLEEALAEFEAALKLDPNTKVAHLAAGAVKARLHREDEALKHFREVLRIDPLNLQAHLRAARVLLAKREIDRAQEFAESAQRIDPQSPAVHLFLGHLALIRKDLATAKKHLTQALTFNPRLVRARLQMAAVLRNEGKLDEALAQVNAAVRIAPDNAVVFDALGKLQLIRKDFNSAREAFEKAITLQPGDDQESLIGLTEALIEEGQLDRAEEMLRKAPARLESRPGIHKVWGDLYEKRGLYPEAVEEYKAAQVLAEKYTGTPVESAETSLPAADDLAGWKALAGELRKSTDAFRDSVRLQLTGISVEADD